MEIVFAEAAGIRMGQMRLNFQYSLSFMKSVTSEVGSEAEHDLSTITPLWISFYGFLNANRLSYSLFASKMAGG